MNDLNKVFDLYRKDINDVAIWSEAQYNNYFAEHFKKVRELYDRLKSTDDPITDNELEWILTWLPLELINVAEKLEKLKTVQDVIKSNIKVHEADKISEMMEVYNYTVTKAKEQVAIEMSADRMLVSVYDNLTERVNREVSFSKELIMSSKKIWDARRNAEQPMPSIPGDDLPEYQEPIKPSTYIK